MSSIDDTTGWDDSVEIPGSPDPLYFLTHVFCAETGGIRAAPHRYQVRGKQVLVGRGVHEFGCQVDDSKVSRSHFALRFFPSTRVYQIEDLDSVNGTFVDGQRVKKSFLRPGSVIHAGNSLFVWEELTPHPLVGRCDLNAPMSLARANANALADLVAPTSAALLIHGPTGSGKEILAKRIHEASKRSGRLVAENCASFDSELLASKLFGHVAGAFSGARSDRPGLFREADGGTLHLDEIAELPLERQASLLRVLQEGRFAPVGSDREVKVNVRIIAATHVDLQARIEAGQFREDLFARFASIRLELHGLAEQPVDILPLFSRFLDGEPMPLSLRAAEALLVHPWPRNIRELQDVARYVGLYPHPRDRIEANHLPPELLRQRRAGSGGAPGRDELAELLSAANGCVAEVARSVGRQRKVVYKWCEQLGVDPAQFRDTEKNAA